MNRQEAAQVLAVMAAPHPWDVEEDMAQVWHQAALQDVSLDVGLAVAIRLVETEERFPTPAKFNETRRALERAVIAPLPALVPPSDRASGAEWIGKMRAHLHERNGNLQKHRHQGPAPCPVCGGIAP